MKTEQVEFDELVPGDMFDFVEDGAHHLGLRARGLLHSSHPAGIIKLATGSTLAPAGLSDARLIGAPVQRHLESWEVVPDLGSMYRQGEEQAAGTFIRSRGLGECILCKDYLGRSRTFGMRTGFEPAATFPGDRAFRAWTLSIGETRFTWPAQDP